MGAILCVVGEAGDPGIGATLARMLARSPCRGEPTRVEGAEVALAVQVNGDEAAIGGAGPVVVAFHGDLGPRAGLERLLDGAVEPGLGAATLLARAWCAAGSRVLEEIEGEVALVVHDRAAGLVAAYRTPAFGRPLFVAAGDGRVLLATEIRQLLAALDASPELNLEAAVRLLLGLPGSDGDTLFEGVRRVMPGSMHRWRVGAPVAAPTRELVWAPPEPIAWPWRSRAEAIDRVRGTLDAVVADAAPAGSFAVALSGGLDSSAVWATLARHGRTEPAGWPGGRPFSYGLPGFACDESLRAWAMFAATGADGVLLDLAGTDPLAGSDELLAVIDQPADPAVACLAPLIAAMAEDDRRVMLTGEGGDEWFRHPPVWLGDELRRGRVGRYIGGCLQLVAGRGTRSLRRALGEGLAASGLVTRRRQAVPEWLGESCVELALDSAPPPAHRDAWRRAAVAEQVWQSTHLEAVEQVAAASRVEVRHPLLRQKFAEAVLALPGPMLGNLRSSKQLLREAAADRLPAAVREAVSLPLDDFLDRPASTFARSLSPLGWRLVDEGLVRQQWLQDVIQTVSGQGWSGSGAQLWRVWMVEQFLRRR